MLIWATDANGSVVDAIPLDSPKYARHWVRKFAAYEDTATVLIGHSFMNARPVYSTFEGMLKRGATLKDFASRAYDIRKADLTFAYLKGATDNGAMGRLESAFAHRCIDINARNEGN